MKIPRELQELIKHHRKVYISQKSYKELLMIQKYFRVILPSGKRFLNAAARGHLGMTKFQMGLGVSSAEKSKAFHTACRRGHACIVELMTEVLSRKELISERLGFVVSCARGHADVVKILIAVLPTVTIRSENNEAFLYACAFGRVRVVKILLEVLDIEELRASRILESVYNFDQPRIAKILIDAGLEDDIKCCTIL